MMIQCNSMVQSYFTVVVLFFFSKVDGVDTTKYMER